MTAASIFTKPPTGCAPMKSNHHHSTIPSSLPSAPSALKLPAAAGIDPNGCNPDGSSTLLTLPDFWQPHLNNLSSILPYGCSVWTVSYLKPLCPRTCPKISTAPEIHSCGTTFDAQMEEQESTSVLCTYDPYYCRGYPSLCRRYTILLKVTKKFWNRSYFVA